jgi:hypothetical protein
MRFYQADAARRRGQIWADPEMEQAAVSRRVGHPFGLYFQATARQRGRRTADTLHRFRRARELLRQDRPDGDDRNIQGFLVACINVAEAACCADQDRWDEALTAVERRLASLPGSRLPENYTDDVPPRGSIPAQEAADRLLIRVPCF